MEKKSISFQILFDKKANKIEPEVHLIEKYFQLIKGCNITND
ncbi:MAG: hypothetical protein NWE91_01555 [Candidatus Bathyarchaeota archaeon]|nr:hypothetical protein [Candidatus Bathyarchaeota archaeon]